MLGRARVSLSLAAVAAMAAAVVVPIDGAGAAEMTGVLVRDSNFAPAEQRIHAGDTVIFARTKDTKLAHSVTSDTGAFDVEINDQQAYAGFRFPTPGTYAYHCKYHRSFGMTGVIVVEDGPTTTTSGPGATTTTTATTGPTTTTSTAPTTTTSTA
ncbi:MAG: cupredoxin domain-containing protein, partial [Actinomycetota bacterium]